MQHTIHDVRFPNESPEYRAARDKLLEAEIALRRQIEDVAAQRRALPLGGRVTQDYVFQEGDDAHPVKLSELFGDKSVLLLYSYMYGPTMAQPCPSCTSILDGLDGQVHHIRQRAAIAAVARSPIARVRAVARERGWRRLRLLSSATNSYHQDYHREGARGDQLPILNVFVRAPDGRSVTPTPPKSCLRLVNRVRMRATSMRSGRCGASSISRPRAAAPTLIRSSVMTEALTRASVPNAIVASGRSR